MSSVVKSVSGIFKKVTSGVSSLVKGVTGVVGGLLGAQESYSAGTEAKQIAAQNAAASAAETAEYVKRMEAANARQQSLARARAAASGAGGASTDVYMEALAKAGREEVDWLKEVGATNYEKAIAEGRVAKTKSQSGTWGSLIEAGGALAGLFL